MTFVVAFMAENHDFWYCYKQFLGRDSGTSTVEAVEDVMEVEQVLSDKPSNARVIRDGLILATINFISHCRPLDAAVINVWPGNMGISDSKRKVMFS
jgi:hypothetical protein